MNVCRSCNAPVIWARTRKGKAMPVDRLPTVKGNIQLVPQRGGAALAHVLTKGELEAARAEGETLHMSHYASCPQGRNWRRRS